MLEDLRDLEGEELLLSDVWLVEAKALALACLVPKCGKGSFDDSVVSMGCTAIWGVSVGVAVVCWEAVIIGECCSCCDC